MPQLVPRAADAATLLRTFLEYGDVTHHPDGSIHLSFFVDPWLLDQIAAFGAADEDLEPIEDLEPTIGWPEDGAAVIGAGLDSGLCIDDECESEPREEDDPAEEDDPNDDTADDEEEVGEDDARDLPELGADGRPIPPRRFANGVRDVITETKTVVSLRASSTRWQKAESM